MGLWVTAGERRCVEMMKMTTMVQQARLVGEMTRSQLLLLLLLLLRCLAAEVTANGRRRHCHSPPTTTHWGVGGCRCRCRPPRIGRRVQS